MAVCGAALAQKKNSHLEKSSREVGCNNKTVQGRRRKGRIKATRDSCVDWSQERR